MNTSEMTASTDLIEIGDGITLNANTNYQPRCPTVFILDTSGSMAGLPIQALNDALPGLIEDLRANELTSLRVEPCLITCGGKVEVRLPFSPLNAVDTEQLTFPASGETPMGAALLRAMELVAERRSQYRAQGLASYRPAIVVLSDGHPTDFAWLHASEKLGKLARDERKGWTVIAVGIGSFADMEALSRITSPSLPPQQLKGLRFAEFFRWISESLQSGTSVAPSQANPGGLNLGPTSTWSTSQP